MHTTRSPQPNMVLSLRRALLPKQFFLHKTPQLRRYLSYSQTINGAAALNAARMRTERRGNSSHEVEGTRTPDDCLLPTISAVNSCEWTGMGGRFGKGEGIYQIFFI